MTVFNSKINPGSESFRKNREEMLAHIVHLQELYPGVAFSASDRFA